jgi:hypothetical protein
MHTTKHLKKKSYHIFIQPKLKKYVWTCILTLITSLLKPRELGQNFKKTPKKLFYFLLTLRIMHLYVRCSLHIKKIVFFLTLEWLGFYPIR